MRSLRLVLVGLFASALLLPASAVWAGGGLDRPDLMDVDGAYFTDDDSYSYNFVYSAIVNESDAPYASGSVSGTTGTGEGSGSVTGVLFWHLYEPDQVGRQQGRARLRQNRYVNIGATVVYHTSGSGEGSSFTSGTVEGCLAALRMKDTTPTSDRSDAESDNCPDDARWRLYCEGGIFNALTDLGLSPENLARLLNVLDSSASQRTLRGRDTDSDYCQENF